MVYSLYMYIRRLQKTGGSSLTVTLPKKWLTQCGLGDKDEIHMSMDKQFTLSLCPVRANAKPVQAQLAAEGYTATQLVREVVARYISGVDEIVITANALSPLQRQAIRRQCLNLVGFELVEESAQQMVLKNIFDLSKLPLSASVDKMFLLSNSMFHDAVQAVTAGDTELSQDVYERDAEVDKLNLAITRQMFVCLSDALLLEAEKLTDVDLYYYQLIARQLERIGDHAVKIADLTNPVQAINSPAQQKVIVQLAQRLALARTMIASIDSQSAHELLDQSGEIEKMIRRLQPPNGADSVSYGIIKDSLDRIRGYIMNMAEATLDQAVLMTS